MTWQSQYNLTHLTVPKSMRALLPDLEAIERVMVDKQNKKLKARGKVTAACPDAKSNPKRKAPGGSSEQVPNKKACSEKFCQRCKAHSSPYQTHNTLDCCCYDSNGKPLAVAAGRSCPPAAATESYIRDTTSLLEPSLASTPGGPEEKYY
jgi:hypothetical protein